MMGRRKRDQGKLFYVFRLEGRIPENHLLRRMNVFVTVALADLQKELTLHYSEIGRPSVDPELMIRMVPVGYCYGIRSERRLCHEVELHLAYRWFCMLDLDDAVPHHSSFSVNRLGRFRESDVLRHIFERVVWSAMTTRLVKGEGFAVDASVLEAKASRYHGKPPDELDWTDAQRQKRAAAEYLAAAEAEAHHGSACQRAFMRVAAGLARGGPPAPGVWLFNVDTLAGRLERAEACAPRLSDDEIARASKTPDAVMRRRWIASRSALRLSLEAWMKTSLDRQPFQVAPHGRPFLPAPAPSFSLSHAGPFAFVALAEAGPIGADIEEISTRKISTVRVAQMESFAVHLAATALPAGGDARFIQAWTRIEAYAKADGRGVGRVLADAGLLGRGSQAARAMAVAAEFKTAAFRAYDLNVADLAPGYAAAVAGPADAALLHLKVCDGSELLAGFE